MRDTSDPRRVRFVPGGPLLVEGPVTPTGHDGVAVTSERFMVAVCTCRRSRRYPWCDTSHRSRTASPAVDKTDMSTDPESGATA
ncbi:CDGSH iron-sulfur domain-containing protein [Streptomyces sp. NPDC091416]|uniref:CDGSH iron-sulfur domain-containing protein n=1 Tax=Streptomyces sp. NPDC091416 TaxID=3366003 RepID=UPI003803E4F0